jgi:hypothetical protein
MTATIQSSFDSAPLSSVMICWNIFTTTVNMSVYIRISTDWLGTSCWWCLEGGGGTHFSHCGGVGLCNRGRMRLPLLLTGWCRHYITSAQIAYKTPLPTVPPLLHVYPLPRNAFTQPLPCNGQCNHVPISIENLRFSQPWLW